MRRGMRQSFAKEVGREVQGGSIRGTITLTNGAS
jgi:hypothetical protein